MPALSTLGQALVEVDLLSRGIFSRRHILADFELEFDRSERGSLKVITRAKSSLTRQNLKMLAFSIVAALLVEPVTGVVAPDFWRSVLEQLGYPQERLSDEDVQRIAEETVQLLNDRSVSVPKRRLYESLTDDGAIQGFGAVPDDPPGPPRLIIPRSRFPQMTPAEPDDNPEGTRTLSRPMKLTLVRPVLRATSKGKWGFLSNGNRIEARVEDRDFLTRALSGREGIPLAEGVTLFAIVEVIQKRASGTWADQTYVVKSVTDWEPPPPGATLFFDEGEDDNDEN